MATAEDKINTLRHIQRPTLPLLVPGDNSRDGQGQRACSGSSVGATEGPVAQMYGAIRGHSERRSQGFVRLRWAHRHCDDRASIQGAQPYRLAERIDIQLVHFQRHTLSYQAAGLRIKAQCRQLWYLFYAHDNSERSDAL